jgi:acetolactate decarboxylase
MLKLLLFLSIFISYNLFASIIWDKKVYYKNTITNTLEKSQINPQIDLKTLENKENLYAIGMGSYLKGEIQIFNTSVKNSYVKNNQVAFDNTFNKKATFLVYTQVREWEVFKVPYYIYNKKQFEEWLETTADEYGIDSYEPFPFLLEGTLKVNSYRVLDASVNEKVKTGELITCACAVDSDENKGKIRISTIYDTILHKKINGLGFFYYKKGIITEKSSFINLHFITEDKKIAGYSLDMMIGEDMIVKLPKIR